MFDTNSEPQTENFKCTIEKNAIKLENRCAHWVLRKKRYCKMKVAQGQTYCGEHESTESKSAELILNEERIKCPLDPKHTIYKKKLAKHLKICNARPNDNVPAYIVKNINAGELTNGAAIELAECSKFKLSELETDELERMISKIEQLYNKLKKNLIANLQCKHDSLTAELAKEDYGKETRKHLLQSSALLGILEQHEQLIPNASYIEFGAGKGQLAYFLANVLQTQKLMNSQVVLLDRMSLRYKKDNKVENRNLVQRIRVDIADFKISHVDQLKFTKRNVALSKHLCGAATDLTLRCVTQDDAIRINYILIALCCHHRCDWCTYVGKQFMLREGVTPREFVIITKMASWAICGIGLSRELRKAMEEAQESTMHNAETKLQERQKAQHNLTREQREAIGLMCKRVIDYGRLEYLREKGYKTDLYFYVSRDVTLENICLIATK